MHSEIKAAILSGILLFSILFMGGWIYEKALTRTPAYLEQLK